MTQAVSRPTLVLRAKRLVPASFVEALVLSTAALIISLVLFGLFVTFTFTPKGHHRHSDLPIAIDTYRLLLRGAFGTPYSWRNTFIHASPLLLTALCVAVPARVGLIVIGGEGCVLLGGLMAALTAHLMPNSPPLMVQAGMIVVGMVAGGLWIGLVGALRQFRGVNETISSLLLNYIALAILNHCVEGPMRDPTSLNHPSSFPIGDANMLGNIPGSEVHWGFVYGIIACVFCWFLLDFTSQGFAASVVGGNSRAARVAGLSIAKFTLIACFIGGACAALAGVVEVMAIHGCANDSLAANYGYTGILVAFVARQNPLAVIPVAILLGGVAGSGDLLQAQLGLSSASVEVFEGILFLVILGLDTWSGRFKDLQFTWFARPFFHLAGMFHRKPLVAAKAEGTV